VNFLPEDESFNEIASFPVNTHAAHGIRQVDEHAEGLLAKALDCFAHDAKRGFLN
jgi:hypothetical protein